MSGISNDGYFVADEHGFQVQVGSKLYPEYPVTSVTEALYQLKKTVGSPFQMYPRWYRSHRYIIGLDMEKSVVLVSVVFPRKTMI